MIVVPPLYQKYYGWIYSMVKEKDKHLMLICRLFVIAIISRRISSNTGDLVVMYASILCTLANFFVLIIYLVKQYKEQADKQDPIKNKNKKSKTVAGVAGLIYCVAILSQSIISVISIGTFTGTSTLFFAISGIAISVFAIAVMVQGL